MGLGEGDPDDEGETLADGDADNDGERLGLADSPVEGLGDGETLTDGETEAEGLALPLSDGLTDKDGEWLLNSPSSESACPQLKESMVFRISRFFPNLNDPGGPLSSQSDIPPRADVIS